MRRPALPTRGAVDGFVFQVGQHEDPWLSIKMIAGYATRMGITALVNVRLAPENPAEYLCDENHVANRAAESLVAALASPRVKVFLDTFTDLDRGYFPRIGLYDRRLNPRKGSYVARHLMGALNTRGSGIELDAVRGRAGWRTCTFHSQEHEYDLLLPQRNMKRRGLSQVLDESSGGEIIDLETGRTTRLMGENSEVILRDVQYLHINS